MNLRSNWREIVMGVLVLSLLVISGSAVRLHKQNVALQNEAVKTYETLVNQTNLIVELRKLSVPKEFDSLDELKCWVDDWEVNNKPTVLSILNHTFVISGNSELYSRYWDCDDISEAMQRDALKDGYLMSVALVSAGGVVLDHAGCMVTIENAYWFIEPQTGEIVLIAGRD